MYRLPAKESLISGKQVNFVLKITNPTQYATFIEILDLVRNSFSNLLNPRLFVPTKRVLGVRTKRQIYASCVQYAKIINQDCKL